MKVPMLDLAPQYEPIRAEVFAAIEKVYDSKKFILGEEVGKFEVAAAKYTGAKHAVGVSSGTDALLISLMAAGVGAGDEVITTDFSFFATAGAISRVGATPVFADIDPVTFNIDPRLVASKITSRTKAVIPVHLYGQCADMEEIASAVRGRGIAVIEDAAQSLGARYRDGRGAGALGDYGCFSFFPSKNLGAMGDAGMVTTDDAGLADKLRLLRGHGAVRKYYHSLIGGNFRIDTIQAAVLDVKLKYLDGWTSARQENARRYDKLFADAGLVSSGEVTPPAAVYKKAGGPERYHIYNQYMIRARSRDDLKKFLDGSGIGNDIYYPMPFHLQECFAHLGGKPGYFPQSEKAAAEVLALPVYPELKPEMQEYVVSKIKEFYKNRG